MIMVIRDVGIAMIQNLPARVSVTIPNRRTSSIFVDGAFDLIR